LIFTFMVSCVTNGIFAFLCMESFYMHSTTFIISWHIARTSFLCKMVLWAQGYKPCREATFCM
jgi:hypothetical protein